LDLKVGIVHRKERNHENHSSIYHALGFLAEGVLIPWLSIAFGLPSALSRHLMRIGITPSPWIGSTPSCGQRTQPIHGWRSWRTSRGPDSWDGQTPYSCFNITECQETMYRTIGLGCMGAWAEGGRISGGKRACSPSSHAPSYQLQPLHLPIWGFNIALPRKFGTHWTIGANPCFDPSILASVPLLSSPYQDRYNTICYYIPKQPYSRVILMHGNCV